MMAGSAGFPDLAPPVDLLPPGDPKSLAEQTRLRMLWEKTMEHAPKFVRYEQVAVLMLSWDDTCDDLKTKQEVERLAAVFKDKYHFKVRQERLHHEERPQAQMNEHLATFVRTCERQCNNTLMIIYYAGHGWPDGVPGKQELRLAGNTSQKAQPGLARNSIMWQRAESNIQEADADVFLIFDCCNSGIISRSEARRFETLSACSHSMKTHAPGESSFTSALIWALEQLYMRKEKPFFSSSELWQMIMKAPKFPRDQHPVLAEREPSLDHVVIAPFTANNTPLEIPPDQSEGSDRAKGASYLDLRFHCDRLDDDGIKDIAKALNKLLMDRQLSARRIDFLGKDWKSRQWQSVLRIAEKWFENVKASRLQRESIPEGGITTGLMPALMTPDTTSAVVSDDGIKDTALTTSSVAAGIKSQRMSPSQHRNRSPGSADTQSSKIHRRGHRGIRKKSSRKCRKKS